jgi:putative ABC transport system permease protein
MLRHYLTHSLRALLRFKLTTTISVVGLALGLMCFVATYLVLQGLLKSDQHFPKASRIYVLTEELWSKSERVVPAFPSASPPAAKYLQADFPALEAVARALRLLKLGAASDDRKATLNVAAVDPAFLRIFDLPFVEGDPASALAGAHSAVVTQDTANRLFGTTHAVGRHLLLENQMDLTVTAVIHAVPQPSHMGESDSADLSFQMLVPMNLLRDFQALPYGIPANPDGPDWGNDLYTTYALLPANGSLTPAALIEGLQGFGKRHVPPGPLTLTYSAVPLSRFRLTLLEALLGGQVSLSITTGLIVLDAIILLIACLNYANLSVAVSTLRAREIGMRRVVGANRLHLVRQYLLEAALMGGIALIIVLVGVAAGLKPLSNSLGIDLPLSSLAQPGLWLLVLALLASVTLVGGAYPALVLSGVRPIDALRAGTVRAGPRFVPTVLVGVQFAAASFLLLAVILMFNQNSLLKQVGLKPEQDPVVVITNNLTQLHINKETLDAELLADPHIRSVSAARDLLWTSGGQHLMVQKNPQASASSRWVILNPVAHDFFSTLGIGLLAGRTFDRQHNDAFSWGGGQAASEGGPGSQGRQRAANIEDPVIVDRSLAREMGWVDPSTAVGQHLYDHDQMPGGGMHTMRIIGVVADGYPRLTGPNTDSNVYVLSPPAAGVPVIRVARENIPAALKHVDAVWERLAPKVPLNRVFADELFNRAYEQFARYSKILEGLAALAFLIAMMGLFGMAIHVASRRRRELGIRKTLGASASRLTLMLLRDFARPVVIANILVWPLAFLAGRMYLNLFVQRTPMSPWPFVASLVITLCFAWIVVGGQAIKAATVKPAKVLYQE